MELVKIRQVLDSKQDQLVDGKNFKTINGISLLGPGDLAVISLPYIVKFELASSPPAVDRFKDSRPVGESMKYSISDFPYMNRVKFTLLTKEQYDPARLNCITAKEYFSFNFPGVYKLSFRMTISYNHEYPCFSYISFLEKKSQTLLCKIPIWLTKKGVAQSNISYETVIFIQSIMDVVVNFSGFCFYDEDNNFPIRTIDQKSSNYAIWFNNSTYFLFEKMY